MKATVTSHLARRVTRAVVAALAFAVVAGVIPQPPDLGADTRTRPGTIGQEITYVWGRYVEYQHCVREGPLFPFGWGCLDWETRTRLEYCSGPENGCSVVDTYTTLTCSGYWVGNSCRENVPHQHSTTTTTTTSTTTTTTRPPPTTTTTSTTRPPPATNPPTTSPPATSPPTTSPPVTSPPVTSPPTTSPPATRCLPLSTGDLAGVLGVFGWGSALDRPGGVASGVAGGDELPVGAGPSRLFVTSNKLVHSASAEPGIWPLAPTGVSVTGRGTLGHQGPQVDCVWELLSVRSEWRELLVWRQADRAGIARVAPEFAAQWDRMGTAQRRVVQNRHRSSGVEDPPEVVCRVDDVAEEDCAFFVSHPSVWEWELWATFRTATSRPPGEQTLLVADGVSRLGRLIDYTTSWGTVCGGVDC